MERKPIFTGAASALVTPLNENGVDFDEFQKLIEFQNTTALTDADFSYFSLENSDDILKNLAKQMQDVFVSTLNPGSNRKAKPSTGVYLMEHIQNPGVLIECGFLSNPAEEQKLLTSEYQALLGEAIAQGAAEYWRIRPQ